MEDNNSKIKEEHEPQYCIKCGAPLHYYFEIEIGICENCMIKLLKDT